MKKTLEVLLVSVLVPLVLPLGLLAVMLNPFLEIFYEEDKHGNSK